MRRFAFSSAYLRTAESASGARKNELNEKGEITFIKEFKLEEDDINFKLNNISNVKFAKRLFSEFFLQIRFLLLLLHRLFLFD